MKRIIKKLKKTLGGQSPSLALILGSGLSDACPDFEILKEISYKKLGMPSSKVRGHSKNLVIGRYRNELVIKLSRHHYYESGNLRKVSLPFEMLNLLGVKDIVLVTATGGVSEKAKKGDIFLVKDHINFAPNPLIGRKDQYFVSLNNAYDEEYRNKIKEIALKKNILIQEGVHAQVTGPSYETLGEALMLKTMGADTVSMSTAQDVILSRFFQMKVLCFAIVSNMVGEEITHKEVLENSQKISKKLKILLTDFLNNKILK